MGKQWGNAIWQKIFVLYSVERQVEEWAGWVGELPSTLRYLLTDLSKHKTTAKTL